MPRMTVFHRNENRGDLPESLEGGVLAIGNFDGVHRGHQAVLSRALEIASLEGAPMLALTFEPHPRTVFNPDKPVFRLTPAPLKAKLLESMGFNAVLEYPFDRAFSGRSAEEFIQSILKDWIGVRHVVTGFDFHFGKGREGGPAFLLEAGGRHGFGVTLVDAFRDENTEVVSSSRIRTLIGEGDVSQAAGLLGYRYTVEAPVIHGKKLGRTIGFPTANMALPSECGLKPGVYAVRFRKQDGMIHDGVASFGYRPTVTDNGAALLETMLFDFSGDLYGQTCSVSFFGFLRPEEKYDGLDPLIAQMNRDVEEARALLARVQPLGELDRMAAF
jgi:riboflavin kinase / FMN adenylyltransferase